MRTVADVIRASRSNLHNRLNGSAKPSLGYHKARDVTTLLRLPKLVAKRTNYGYPRITALLNGDLRSLGLPPVNNKRVYRIMANSSLLLE
jgi:hypothetical protein